MLLSEPKERFFLDNRNGLRGFLHCRLRERWTADLEAIGEAGFCQCLATTDAGESKLFQACLSAAWREIQRELRKESRERCEQYDERLHAGARPPEPATTEPASCSRGVRLPWAEWQKIAAIAQMQQKLPCQLAAEWLREKSDEEVERLREVVEAGC